MNTFTLLTALGAFGVISSFFYRARPASSGRRNAFLRFLESNANEKLFGLGVGLIVLAALHAG